MGEILKAAGCGYENGRSLICVRHKIEMQYFDKYARETLLLILKKTLLYSKDIVNVNGSLYINVFLKSLLLSI